MDDSLVVTALFFEHTTIVGRELQITGMEESYDAGLKLGEAPEADGLVHLMLLKEYNCCPWIL